MVHFEWLFEVKFSVLIRRWNLRETGHWRETVYLSTDPADTANTLINWNKEQ